MAQKVSYCILSLSLLNVDQFSQFSSVDSVGNLLHSDMHTTLVMSLHL